MDYIIPSILSESTSKIVESYLKTFHLNKNEETQSIIRKGKMNSFALLKNKMGYLVPFNAKYSMFDDHDFSNSFLIKAHMEAKDAKSIYAYYILTKPDFTVENFSSSAIHLGLSMDLLKKYIINLNVLIRSNRDNNINLSEKFKDYEEAPKRITWVYPDIIYPKNDDLKKKDINIKDLIKISNKKLFNLQIFEKKNKEGEIIGFIFKFI